MLRSFPDPFHPQVDPYALNGAVFEVEANRLLNQQPATPQERTVQLYDAFRAVRHAEIFSTPVDPSRFTHLTGPILDVQTVHEKIHEMKREDAQHLLKPSWFTEGYRRVAPLFYTPDTQEYLNMARVEERPQQKLAILDRVLDPSYNYVVKAEKALVYTQMGQPEQAAQSVEGDEKAQVMFDKLKRMHGFAPEEQLPPEDNLPDDPASTSVDKPAQPPAPPAPPPLPLTLKQEAELIVNLQKQHIARLPTKDGAHVDGGTVRITRVSKKNFNKEGFERVGMVSFTRGPIQKKKKHSMYLKVEAGRKTLLVKSAKKYHYQIEVQ